MKKYTIFSTDTMQYSAEDVRECLMANDVAESAITDDMIADIRFRWMSDDYDDLIAQIETCDEFPCYTKANLGLWYGRRQAYAQDKDLKSAIMRCLAGMDDYEIEETPYGKLMITGYHHDGTNYYEIYKGTAESNKRNIHLRRLLGWIN